VIKEVKINNFKSVQDLTLSLSQFNVLIGSNGSGKSNILEAIAFGAAASADKLDNEFLGSRGIRTADSRLMKSAFSAEAFSQAISLEFMVNEKQFPFTIEEQDKPILKWVVQEKIVVEERFSAILRNAFKEELFNLIMEADEDKDAEKLSSAIKQFVEKNDAEAFNEAIKLMFGTASPIGDVYKRAYHNEILANFIVYSPEISSLRKFEEESQIKPLGIKGEGLFNLLQIFNENYGPETIEEIKNYLNMIEWFDDFEAIDDKVSGRKSLVIKDRYIKDLSLNQNNVNEGFLFLLFYISLIISKETPFFFAIDNLEASFHPRLCQELTKNLIKLCHTYNKQVIITTHNPFVLDGLDLKDVNQSLFVVTRNSEGETIANKIKKQPKDLKLSEAWMRGYIGGQPETIE